MAKNIVRILINTAIGAVLIFFWFKLVDVNQIVEELKTLNYWSTLPFIGFLVLSSILRSFRIKILLSEVKVPIKNLIPLTFLSQLLSFTIPLRVGELTKAVYLSTEYKVVFSKAIIWVFLDRFLDFWLLLITVFVLLFFIPTSLPSGFQNTLTLIIALVSIAGTMALFLPKLTKKVVQLMSYLLIVPFLKKILVKVSDFVLDTTSVLQKSFKDNLLLGILTFLALLSDGASWYSLFQVFKDNTDFPKVFFGSLLSSLTYMIPAAPGYVGSAEASGLAVYAYGLGMDKNIVSVVTVVAHGLTLLYILVFGLASLYFLKFNLNLVWKKLKKD